MGISFRDFLDLAKSPKPAAPTTAPRAVDSLASGPLFTPPTSPTDPGWATIESVRPVSTFHAEPPPVLPSRLAVPGVVSESSGAAPNQAARRGAQSARPLLESIDLPLGLQRDVNAAAQGATFGFSDELAARLRALGGQNYDDAIAAERAGLAKFKTEHPGRAFVDELAGGVASTALLPSARAATAAGRVAHAAATGVFAGGLAGAGSAEGGIDERAGGALKGALIGGVFGTALSGAGEGIAGVSRRIGESGDQAANRLIARALARDDMNIAKAMSSAATFSDDKPATIMDLGGRNVQRLARAVRTQSSKGSNRLDEALTQRGLGAEERTINDVIATTGLGGRKNAFQKAEELIAQQKTNAKPLYEKAYAGPAIDHPEVLGLLKDPDFRAAYNRGARLAKKEGVEFPEIKDVVKKGVDGAGDTVEPELPASIPVQAFDYIKRGLDDVIEGKTRTGGMGANEARVLRNQLRGARDLVDASHPDYAAARSQFAGDAGLQDAFDLGRKLFKTHPDEAVLALNGMGAGEKELFRRGALESLADRIENKVPGRDPSDIAAKTMDKKRLRMLFDSDEQYAAFQKRLGEEARMHGTKSMVKGNSQSIDKGVELLDMADVPVADAIAAAVTHPGSIVKRLARSAIEKPLARYREGVTEGRSNALADRLLAGTNGRTDLTDMLTNVERGNASSAARPLSRVGSGVASLSHFASDPLSAAAALDTPNVRSLPAVAMSPDEREAEQRRRLFAQFLRANPTP